MTTILLLLTVLALASTACAATTYSRDFTTNPIAPVNQSDAKLTHSDGDRDNIEMEMLLKMESALRCFDKISHQTHKCQLTLHSKWNTTPIESMFDFGSRSICCSIWEISDCVLDNAKSLCSPSDERIFCIYMNYTIDKHTVENCPAFPYGQNNCSLGPQNVIQVDTDNMEIEMQLICLSKIMNPGIQCIKDIETKWNITPWISVADINSRSICCATWEISDCMLDNVQILCNPNESRIFFKHMEYMRAQKYAEICAAIPYEQNNCSVGPLYVDPVQSELDNLTREPGVVETVSEQVNLVNRATLKHKSVLGNVTNALIEPSIDKHATSTKDSQAIADVMSLLYNRTPLASQLLDRVNRITLIIDLHPVNKTPTVPTQRYDKPFKP